MKEIRLCDNAEPKRVLELCQNYNLGIEIQGFFNPNLMNTDEPQKLIYEYNEILMNFKKGKSLHAPFWDLNLGSKNTFIRNITMNTFNYAYDVAKKLGCTEIVVHNGFVLNTSYYDGWVRNATTFWQEFFDGKDNSITMMIENQCEEDSEVLKREIDSINDPRLKICLDIGHANANSNKPVEDWITTLGERIGYVHLHNNHGKLPGRPAYLNDEHLGLDMGNIDIIKTFELLEKCCPNAIWNVECKLDYMNRAVEILDSLNYIL